MKRPKQSPIAPQPAPEQDDTAVLLAELATWPECIQRNVARVHWKSAAQLRLTLSAFRPAARAAMVAAE